MVYTSLKENTENILDDFQDVDTSKVSDNIEEAVSSLIYETEVNWNTLMQSVGIAELTAMENVGEVIYEAVDIKAFFAKVKEFFKGLLEKIARIFKKLRDLILGLGAMVNGTIKYFKFKKLQSVPSSFEYDGYHFLLNKVFDDNLIPPVYDQCLKSTHLFMDDKIWGLIGVDDDKYDDENDFFTKWIQKANDPDTKKKTIDEMRNCLLGLTGDSSLNGEYDWNKELFKYFRDGQDKPTKLTAKDINLNEYLSTIMMTKVVGKTVLNQSYNAEKKEIEDEISRIERHINHLQDVSFRHEQIIKILNIRISYMKSYLQDLTSWNAARFQAFIDAAKQYNSALVKMLQMTKSGDNSANQENDKVTNEDFDMTHSLLDNVNFI